MVLLTTWVLVLRVVLLVVLVHGLLHAVLWLHLEVLLLKVLLLRGLWRLRCPPGMLLLLLLLLLLLIHRRIPCGHWLSVVLDTLLWCVLRVTGSDHPIVGVDPLTAYAGVQDLPVLAHHHRRRLWAPHWTSHHRALPWKCRDSNSDPRRLSWFPV